MTDVARIVEDVRERGDEAVAEWSRRFDGVEPRLAEPAGEIPEDAVRALADARAALARSPAARRRAGRGDSGRRARAALGALALGGDLRAEAASSPRSSCAPSRRRSRASSGSWSSRPPQGAGVVAAAARLLGLEEVWAVGGPQAIAALAYGTETIAAVDKVVGPGNAFVNEAKHLVSRDVAVDLPAGPSELVVLASAGADRSVAALELDAQREHGPDSVCRLVEGDGDLESALRRVEDLAPEHLVLLGDDAEQLAPRVRNAGAVFVGQWSSVAAGDYATGGNHVLPTGGRARAVGGIGLETFLKPVTIQRLTAEGLGRVRPVVEALAAVEGLPAHAEAVRR